MNGFAGILRVAAGRPTASAETLPTLDRSWRIFDAGCATIAAPSSAVAADGPSLLALNGWVDAGPDWGRERARPERTTDASLVLGCLRNRGLDALPRLRGEFGFAFWDETTGCLTLATDALGLRPALYARSGDRFVFATGLRALLSMPGIDRDIDDAYLAAFLSDVTPEADTTFYRSIRRVPAACTLTIRPDGSTVLREYWRPDWERRIRHRRDETYVEEARSLLDRAVQRQLRGTGPTVCMLSGGLDSAAVAATAARIEAPGAVHALTVAPPEGVPCPVQPARMADERALAGAVARMYPNMIWNTLASHHLHPLDENPLRLLLPLGMPVRNAMNIGWFAPLFDHAKTIGAGTILGGAFGNLTLGWSGVPGLAGMAKRGEWVRVWREASAIARVQGAPVSAILRGAVLRPLLTPRMQAWLDSRRGRPLPDSAAFSAIHPDFARDTDMHHRMIAMGDDYGGDSEAVRRRWLRRVQRLPPLMSSLSEVLGVHIRDPMADLDLLAFCFAVPDEQYLRNGVTRWLARRVLADRLPAAVVNETRRGVQCAEFFHRMTLQREDILAGVEALEHSPLASRALDVARLKRLARDWPADAASAPAGDYLAVLHRGLHVGRFLRWVEGGNT